MWLLLEDIQVVFQHSAQCNNAQSVSLPSRKPQGAPLMFPSLPASSQQSGYYRLGAYSQVITSHSGYELPGQPCSVKPIQDVHSSELWVGFRCAVSAPTERAHSSKSKTTLLSLQYIIHTVKVTFWLVVSSLRVRREDRYLSCSVVVLSAELWRADQCFQLLGSIWK